MNKNLFCPVSEQSVNKVAIRTQALVTVSILILILFTQNIYLGLFLLLDFLVRAINLQQLSLTGHAARLITRLLPFKRRLENAGPKQFAARIGFIFSLAIIIALYTGNMSPALLMAGLLMLFSFLEGAFGICVACIIYPHFYRLLYNTGFSAE